MGGFGLISQVRKTDAGKIEIIPEVNYKINKRERIGSTPIADVNIHSGEIIVSGKISLLDYISPIIANDLIDEINLGVDRFEQVGLVDFEKYPGYQYRLGLKDGTPVVGNLYYYDASGHPPEKKIIRAIENIYKLQEKAVLLFRMENAKHGDGAAMNCLIEDGVKLYGVDMIKLKNTLRY